LQPAAIRVSTSRKTANAIAPNSTLRRKEEGRIFQIDVPIRMYIRYKDLALIFQDLQQRKGLAVQPIHAQPLEANPAVPRVQHDLQRQFNFGFVNPVRLGEIRLLAAAPVASPFFGQVQSRVDQTRSIRLTEGANDTDLTIILLAQAAVPLARTPDRFFAFSFEGHSHPRKALRQRRRSPNDQHSSPPDPLPDDSPRPSG
jgi:hypothetical protein